MSGNGNIGAKLLTPILTITLPLFSYCCVYRAPSQLAYCHNFRTSVTAGELCHCEPNWAVWRRRVFNLFATLESLANTNSRLSLPTPGIVDFGYGTKACIQIGVTCPFFSR